MQHQEIYKQLGLSSYNNYTRLRNKYRFFAYITDLLTLDYVLNLDISLIQSLLADLQEILKYKSVMRGLDLALFGNLSCFKPDTLNSIRSLATPVNRYQSHKWAATSSWESEVYLTGKILSYMENP